MREDYKIPAKDYLNQIAKMIATLAENADNARDSQPLKILEDEVRKVADLQDPGYCILGNDEFISTLRIQIRMVIGYNTDQFNVFQWGAKARNIAWGIYELIRS